MFDGAARTEAREQEARKREVMEIMLGDVNQLLPGRARFGLLYLLTTLKG